VRHATDYFDEIPNLTPAPELLRLAAGEAATPADHDARFDSHRVDRYSCPPWSVKESPGGDFQPDEAIQKRVDHIVNTYSGLVAQGKEKFAAARLRLRRQRKRRRRADGNGQAVSGGGSYWPRPGRAGRHPAYRPRRLRAGHRAS
jgi:hypothetical protein